MLGCKIPPRMPVGSKRFRLGIILTGTVFGMGFPISVIIRVVLLIHTLFSNRMDDQLDFVCAKHGVVSSCWAFSQLTFSNTSSHYRTWMFKIDQMPHRNLSSSCPGSQ